MGVETILGGIGFLVIYNLCTFKFLHRISGAKGRLSLHTRVVLRFTFYLLALTFIAFLAVEWNLSLKDMSLSDKAVVGFYQAVTPRTCGFCVTPTEALHPLTRLIYECLMFIGGAPGSAAAGMKVTTLAVIIYTATAMCRGETETVMDGRLIPTEIVRESLVILMAIVMFAVVVTGALFVTEAGSGISSDALFFEAVSAVTTTGLAVGDTTASLSTPGRFVIMVAMFIGRLGALTVVLMIGDRESKRHVRFPSEELVVG
jgi:trk system potassium uptake protein TrkH